jgi:hypothetical protein
MHDTQNVAVEIRRMWPVARRGARLLSLGPSSAFAVILTVQRGCRRPSHHTVCPLYPIQKITEDYNKVTELYNVLTELENSSWNILCLLRPEVAYNGTRHILP